MPKRKSRTQGPEPDNDEDWADEWFADWVHYAHRGEHGGWGFAVVGGKALQFALLYDEEKLLGALGVEPIRDEGPTIDNEDARRRWNREQIARADQIEAIMREAVPGVRVRAHVEWDAPSSTGPGGFVGSFLDFLVGPDPITRVAELATIITGWIALKQYLERETGKPVGITSGFAVIIASREVEARYGVRATDLVGEHATYRDPSESWGNPTGYSVVLEGEGVTYSVTVSFTGDVIAVDQAPTTSALKQKRKTTKRRKRKP